MQTDIVLLFKSALKIYILYTLFYFFLKKCKNNFLMLILILNVINTVISTLFVDFKISLAINSSIYVLLHHFLWLLFLNKIVSTKKLAFIPYLFLTFGITNLLIVEGFKSFNFDTFIFGSFLYTLILLYESYVNLKNENLNYFFQNTYLLIFAPLLFFISFSLIFSFSNKTLNNTKLFYDVSLFNFVSLFSNFIYYMCINLYIYRENKLKNV